MSFKDAAITEKTTNRKIRRWTMFIRCTAIGALLHICDCSFGQERTSREDPRNGSLPPAESIVPLPATAAPKDFGGFGDKKLDRSEEIPSPKLPPRYQFPKREQDRNGALPGAQSPGSNANAPNTPTGGSPILPPNFGGLPDAIRNPNTPNYPLAPNAYNEPSNSMPRMADPQGSPQSGLPQVCEDGSGGPWSLASYPVQHSEPWSLVYEDEKRQLENLVLQPGPQMNCGAYQVPYSPWDFAPTPVPCNSYNPCLDLQTYYGKSFIPVQRPWIEWWRPFYTGGMYAPAIPVHSDVNPLTPSFMLYGDYRTGVGIHRDQGRHVRNWAHRLNLEYDLRFTGTERIHGAMGPLDHNNRFTRLDFSDSNDVSFETELDAQFNTLFFEGDAGAITGGYRGVDAPFDLPFTLGLVPLLYQNGIWMEDAIVGAAMGLPWRHSRPFNWCNYDATFFAGFQDVTSPAFDNDKNDALVFGTAWFIEAYSGYIEADYAFLNDKDGFDRDYHNLGLAYTRRYWNRISNSLRLIVNVGQDGARTDRTADGGLLLFENSLVSPMPSTFVPYFNAFLGYGRPQSVARAGGAGGILRNTGILFEGDGLTGYPTLDATGTSAYGGAVGINILSSDFRRQLAFEFAALDTYSNPLLSTAAGAQYGIGTRYQKALTNWSLIRLDLMAGFLDNASDLYGSRIEYRWKF